LKKNIFFIKNCNLLIHNPPYRTSKLQERPSALKREYPAPQNMKFLSFFYFCGLFSSSWIPIQSGSETLPSINFHGKEEMENFVTSLVPVFELRLLQAAQGGVLVGQFVLPDGDLRLQLFQALVGLHQLAVSDSLKKSLLIMTVFKTESVLLQLSACGQGPQQALPKRELLK
jgi:hypothetical protein